MVVTPVASISLPFDSDVHYFIFPVVMLIVGTLVYGSVLKQLVNNDSLCVCVCVYLFLLSVPIVLVMPLCYLAV